MRKLFTAVAAFGLMTSVAAACDYHEQHVMASADQARPSVAMSTHDGMLPPIADEASKTAEAAADSPCTPSADGCAPPAKSASE